MTPGQEDPNASSVRGRTDFFTDSAMLKANSKEIDLSQRTKAATPDPDNHGRHQISRFSTRMGRSKKRKGPGAPTPNSPRHAAAGLGNRLFVRSSAIGFHARTRI